MIILSWNVNGIRACLGKGFLDVLKNENPDILGIQETKVRPEQLEKDFKEVLQPAGYEPVFWNPAERAGYSGTALFFKKKPKELLTCFGIPKFDCEGRTIIAKFNDFTLFNIYYPNGQKDEERLKYKLDFYDAFLDYADKLKAKGENLIIMGDVNTAHREIDLANPKENSDYSGFLPIERAWIDKLLSHGYSDTFREQHPDEKDKYSWWTYRFGARDRNVGWRIDYVFVNKELMPKVKESFILPQITGSDHCPVGIVLE